MVRIEIFKGIACGFPGTTEESHFDKTSFRVAKKIFATLDKEKKLACLKLPAADRDIFSLFDKNIIYPVPNKWGQQGWTNINLDKIPKKMLVAMLEAAYRTVAPATLLAEWEKRTAE